ncbi:sorbose reductase sou1 [Collybia nuda]|uniref:Sorbose reductase sou1 n=1 Tax=Collybia nuda TaxID=64659 RepID=A0A9P5YAC6_9AGAR|nr:sorbose reductase sou1 [Collybia nuda]
MTRGTVLNSLPVHSSSPLAPLGVTAALDDFRSKTETNDNRPAPRPKIFAQFALTDRVAIVSGANQGLGLEMAMALCEAGCRTVYCVDLAEKPSDEFEAVQQFLRRMSEGLEGRSKGRLDEDADDPGMRVGRLEYISADVRDQETMWDIGEKIGDKEGRLDIGVAAAGVPSSHINCLKYPAEQLRKVLDVNTSGSLFTAQAAGRQMERFRIPGSIILVASMSGTITNRGHAWVSYNASKAAVLQMARNMACELGKKGIRVNSLSPGHVYTNMSAAELDTKPKLLDTWSNLNPLGRIGTTDEFRGVVTWLASDASSFCTGTDVIISGGHQSW